MSQEWTTLLSNVGLIAIFVAAWASGGDYLERRLQAYAAPTFGMLAGATSLILMHAPIVWGTGLQIDMRTVPVALAGFFGGPFAAIPAAVLAILYRVMLGGTGVSAGTLSILIAAATGWACRRWRFSDDLTSMRILALALLAATLPHLSILALPPMLWLKELPKLALPMVSLEFVSLLASALVLRLELIRREMLRSNAIYRSITELLPECLNVKDRAGRFIAANPATARLMGAADAESLIGRTDRDFYSADTAERFARDEERVLADGASRTIEQLVTRQDGSRIWLSTLKSPYLDEEGRIIGVITHNRDITEQKRLEAMFIESQARLSDALANMADGLAMFDRHGVLLFCNEQYRRMFPKTADLRVPGARLKEILREAVLRGEERAEDLALTSKGDRVAPLPLAPGRREIALADGRWLEARTSDVREGSLVVFSDITASKQAEELLKDLNHRLQDLAQTDALTGLPNQKAFEEALLREHGRAARNGGCLSVILLEIDHFDTYAACYGRPAADECLRRVAASLRAACKRAIDLPARYGEVRLAAVLPETDLSGAASFAEALRRAIRGLELAHMRSPTGLVTISIGLAQVHPKRDSDPQALMLRAEAALAETLAGAGDAGHAASALPPPDVKASA